MECKFKPGDIVYGKVTNILGYGAFVVVDGYDGLVHISEFSDGFVKDIHSIVNVGDVVNLKVIEINEDNKLRLSYKACNKEPEKILKFVHVTKGFKSLEEHLDEWIDEGYAKITNNNQKKIR